MGERTKSELRNLSGGKLHQLATLMLPRYDNCFRDLVSSGNKEGTAITRPGTPDLWKLTDNYCICVEVTRDDKKKKLFRDFQNNIERIKKSKAVNKLYICFVNYDPQYDSIQDAREKCNSLGIKFELFHNTKIAGILDRTVFHDLRKDFLGIEKSAYKFWTIDNLRNVYPLIVQRYEKKLYYFLEDEESIIQDIRTILRGNNGEQLVLLHGYPAKGKTFLAYYIARKFLEEKFEVFYLKLNSSLSFSEVFPDIIASYSTKTLFIFDDCHLNIDFIAELHSKIFTYLGNISCLLISRTVDKQVWQSSDLVEYDFLGKLEKEKHSFSLDDIPEDRFNRKILGIVECHKSVKESKDNIQLQIGNASDLLENVKRDLFLLDEAIENWDESIPLSAISYIKILHKVEERYLNSLNNSERDLLLRMSALSVYEISFLMPPNTKESCDHLRQLGLCGLEQATELLSMPYSMFASMLIDSYSVYPSFPACYSSKNDFILKQIHDYLNVFPLFPINLEEVFLNLLSHRAGSILQPLLKETDIQKRIFKYYSSENFKIDGLINFLYKTRGFLTQQEQHLYTQMLSIENHKLKESIFNFTKPLLSYVKLLKTLYRISPHFSKELSNKFTDEDYKRMLEESGFELTCYSLHSLKEVEKDIVKQIVNKINFDELLAKACAINLDEIFRGVRHLSHVDYSKAVTILNSLSQLETDRLQEIVSRMRFVEIAESIADLNRIDTIAVGILLNKIPPNFWLSMMKMCNLTSLGYGLSRFKDANPVFAQDLLKLLSDQELQEMAINCWFSRLGNSLAEINKIQKEKAKDIFKSISDNRLIELITRSPFVNIGKGLSELSKVDKPKTAIILNKIDSNFLIEKINSSSINTTSKVLSELYGIDGGIKAQELYRIMDVNEIAKKLREALPDIFGRSICELNIVDSSQTGKILELLDSREVAKKLEITSIIQIGHTLSELNKADPNRAQAVYYYLEIELLIQKARTEHLNFQQLGTLVRQLIKLESGENKTLAILNGIGLENLTQLAKKGQFEILTAGLYDISKLDRSLSKKIISKIEFRTMKSIAKKEQFEKLCSGMNRLASIDRHITKKLLECFDISWSVKRSQNLTADKLGNCLSDLAEANPFLAKSILHAHGVKKISLDLRKLSGPGFQNAIGKLKKVDLIFMAKVLKEVN